MNILDFTLDIWKLFAAVIGCLELKNLVFVNKELFDKVPVLAGTGSMYKYQKLYTKEYYKNHLTKGFFATLGMVQFIANETNKLKMLKVLHKDEYDCSSINYFYVDFVNRPRDALYKNKNKSIGLNFYECTNLPETYSGTISLIEFNNCVVNKAVNKCFIDNYNCVDSTLISAVVFENNVYKVRFNGCKFEKDFNIVFTNGCTDLKINKCEGYMPIIEGTVDVEDIDDNNFLKIEN